MLEKLEKIFDKYNYDFIYINPKDINNINFEYISEETVVDFYGLANYLGLINFNGNIIKVFYDKNITQGDFVFKYNNIKKERKMKLKKL